jgi:hypothetical protein
VSILGVTREGVILVVAQICITELQEKLVSCPTSSFQKYGFAIKPFSLLREHFRDVSFVPLNPARSEAKR